MFQLQKMAEVVAKQGIYDAEPGSIALAETGRFDPDLINAQVYTPAHQRLLHTKFTALLAEAHPFIFHLQAGDTVLEGNDVPQYPLPDLSLPFSTCSFEVSQGRPLSRFTKPEDPAFFPEEHYCVLIREIAPFRYELFMNSSINNGKAIRSGVTYCPEACAPRGLLELVNKYLSFLNAERRMGEEELGHKLKVGSVVDKGGTYVPIKPIIHISDKSYTGRAQSLSGSEIEWSHRWRVRGHWRAITGIGKNREGVYGVDGQTWVVDHLKGPEELSIVEKVRVVRS